MPDDLPLEEPARRIAARPAGPAGPFRRLAGFVGPPAPPDRAAGPAGPHAWESLIGWEALLVLATMVPAVFVIATSEVPPLEKFAAAGLMAAITPVYLLVGRPAIINENRRRGVVYLTLIMLLFTPAVLIEPATTFALFGLCPQCFMVLPARQAILGVIALNLTPAVRFFVIDGGSGGAFNLLTVTMIVIFFSGVFGIWMERIMEQSEERAALIEELEAQRAEVARLSAERGAMAERERLAGEIHDTLAQGFTSIIMLIQAAEAQPDPGRHLALAVRTARENLAEARALVAALAPAPLDGSTLDEALGRLTARLGEETGITTSTAVRGDSRPLAPSTEVVLIRAVQEALANVRKHAAADRVDVVTTYGPESVTLEVRDDGRGFDPAAVDGYGLRGMRTRVEQAGGDLALTSAPGAGTTLEATVPIYPGTDRTASETAVPADPGV
ncbi:sensor histidine kinase [Planobispora siamensis]|uniref:Oxygen sensor histidine kinase NreB n=1 Tax=Planobispora siamensis TaxID=936338 RepID=A0A8J3S895_9ACTN|nr:sensor histidine kinase [Planobispora siamensis]GIH90071.1 two-component sensor histidine kinase [Planobispora siamensis]